ncbi:hypothetical protein QVD17_01397 [Tagetes erecta]|uniref:tRNA-uridine aminocarboxypropyltransferase n=1 Tax=Tagetes erecta TaxID=13708 RepID=A0AAD8P8B0_TARER|nr:hypothetical protein QVD17_01397 [Tagetes erecta]
MVANVLRVANVNEMLSNFGPKSNPLFSIFKPLKTSPLAIIHLSKTPTRTLTLTMATHSGPDNRRPMCQSCSKPTRVCFCNRFKTPILENTISITLLQHNLEKKHPLNSAKIATLGLKNVNLAYVSDVLSEAHFNLHFLELGHHDSAQSHKKIQPLHVLESNLDLGHHDSVQTQKKIQPLHPADISFTVGKRGVINQDFDQLLVDQSVIDGVRNGFIVKKVQRGVDGNTIEEFEMVVPAGSMLLFPSDDSIGIDDVNFNVKNLIVLDGTWAKATRMYNENPWLRLLPHLKLDVDKLSLYGEVRRQPKAGCLSSIESIVYALKAIGEEDNEGLDCLLNVFESMVGDQRRCMNERLNFESNIRAI